VAGMADACRELEMPIVSGNVSLYKETPDGPILPTPVIGTVGLLEDRSRGIPMRWSTGDAILLLGDPGAASASLAGSELAWRRGRFGGSPILDLPAGARLVRLLVLLAADGVVRGAHDISIGGLAAALARLAMASGTGAEVQLPATAVAGSPTAAVYGERPGRVLLAVAEGLSDEVQARANAADVHCLRIGTATAGPLLVDGDGLELRASLAELTRAWSTPF